MWLKKEIKDETAIKIMRLFIALLYFSIGVEFLARPPVGDAYGIHGFKVVSIFCFFISFFSISSMFSFLINRIKYLNNSSIWLSIATIVILHLYLIIAFGVQSNYRYIFLSLALNALIQVPVAYLLEKVEKNEIA